MSSSLCCVCEVLHGDFEKCPEWMVEHVISLARDLSQICPSYSCHPVAGLTQCLILCRAQGCSGAAGGSQWPGHMFREAVDGNCPVSEIFKAPCVGSADLAGGSGVAGWVGASPTGQALSQGTVEKMSSAFISLPGQTQNSNKKLVLGILASPRCHLWLLGHSHALLLIFIWPWHLYMGHFNFENSNWMLAQLPPKSMARGRSQAQPCSMALTPL